MKRIFIVTDCALSVLAGCVACFMPVREAFSGAPLLSGNYAAAVQAFRIDLEKHPRNWRALFGLLESLKRQKKKAAARLVEREFKAAWKNADTHLRVEEL